MRRLTSTQAAMLSAAAALGLAACSDAPTEATPDRPDPGPPTASQPQPVGLDAELVRLAREVPGFGGMYYDEEGRFHVYLKRPEQGAGAIARIRQTVSTRGLRAAGAADDDAVVEQGAYDFVELTEWHERVSPALLTLRGVVYTDVDEARNRLRVGATPEASVEAIGAQLAALEVPRAAVVIDSAAPISRAATLRELLRPVAGGLQIVFPDPPSAFICTVAFNARRLDAVGDFFLTASHCTREQGGVDGTEYFQPSPAVEGSFIGTEVVDPLYGSAGGHCAPARRCRFSDASMAQYADGVPVAFAEIYRTTFSLTRLGSIEIDQAFQRFHITEEAPFPLLGERMSKMGRTTGWTSGRVVITCANVNVSGTDVSLICQDIVDAGVGGGDSGSPVFQQFGTGSLIRLYGMLWGITTIGTPRGATPAFVFSALEQIRLELGPFRVL
jgi:hypothetical protein